MTEADVINRKIESEFHVYKYCIRSGLVQKKVAAAEAATTMSYGVDEEKIRSDHLLRFPQQRLRQAFVRRRPLV